MAVRRRMFWVVECDHADCKERLTVSDECMFSVFESEKDALEFDPEDSEWRVSEDGDKHYCPEHETQGGR